MRIRVQARSVRDSVRRALANTLIWAGSVGVLVWAWGMFEPMLYQHVQKEQLERILIEPRIEQNQGPDAGPWPVAPFARPLATGRSKRPLAVVPFFRRDPLALGEIQIQRLDMSVIVREGMDDSTLRRAAGHVPETALPGQPGNFVVLGHRDTLFRPLRRMEKGDRVRVRTTDGDFSYWIDSIEIVAPEEVHLSEARDPAITLVTCFPFDFIGPAPRRFVARGHLEVR